MCHKKEGLLLSSLHSVTEVALSQELSPHVTAVNSH